MDINKNDPRRGSTPDVSDINPSQDSFHNFRSLRTHRSHHKHLTKKPEVSIILEVDTENESGEENKPKQFNSKNKTRPMSTNSLKFDLQQPIRMGSTRDSRRSTKSIVSTISTKSLDLTKLSRHESISSGGRTPTSGGRTPSSVGGHFNNNFQHSNSNLHRSTSSIHSNVTAPIVREQYFCCRKWSKREKILTTVVATLIILVCGLVVAISIIAEKRAEKIRENLLLAL